VTRRTQKPGSTGRKKVSIYDPKWGDRSAFTVEEAGCEILGLGRVGAYAAAHSGELPTIRVGRRLIVPRAALERLLEGAT